MNEQRTNTESFKVKFSDDFTLEPTTVLKIFELLQRIHQEEVITVRD